MRAASVLAVCLVLSVAVLGRTGGLLGDDAPAPRPVPVFGSGVEVVAVPVFVTDEGGRAVSGLAASDFELREQGRLVPIVAFLPVDAEAKHAPSGDLASAPIAVQAAARRQFLLLFDLVFATPRGIEKARDAADAIVKNRFAPDDLVGVATYSQAGLSWLVGFTSDRAQVLRAIDSFSVSQPMRLQDPLRLAYDLQLAMAPKSAGSLTKLPTDDDRDEFWQRLRSDRDLYRDKVDEMLGGLTQLGAALRAIQGRKQVILLSGGFDSSFLSGASGELRTMAIDEYMSGNLHRVPTDVTFGDTRAQDHMSRLRQVLAAADAVLHSVDTGGMAAGVTVDEPVPVALGGSRESLAELASATGGRFVKDANDLEAALSDLLASTRHYYVLAYEPAEAKGKPKPRKLEVRVLRKGLAVSHRTLWTPPGLSARGGAAGNLVAAEAIAKGLNGGPIALRVTSVPYRTAEGRTLLPTVLEIDGATLAASARGTELKLQVYGYALDGDGRVLDSVSLNPALDLGLVGQRLRERGLQVLTTFAVPEGAVDLRFLVRDTTSGRSGSLRVAAEVPAFDRPFVSRALVVDDPKARLVLPTPSLGVRELPIPFRLGETAFTPDLLGELRKGAPREVCILAWDGARGTPIAYETSLVLLKDGVERVLPAAAPRLVDDGDGFERLVLSVDPGDAAPGDYVLRVLLREPASGSTRTSEARVSVR